MAEILPFEKDLTYPFYFWGYCGLQPATYQCQERTQPSWIISHTMVIENLGSMSTISHVIDSNRSPSAQSLHMWWRTQRLWYQLTCITLWGAMNCMNESLKREEKIQKGNLCGEVVGRGKLSRGECHVESVTCWTQFSRYWTVFVLYAIQCWWSIFGERKEVSWAEPPVKMMTLLSPLILQLGMACKAGGSTNAPLVAIYSSSAWCRSQSLLVRQRFAFRERFNAKLLDHMSPRAKSR